VSMDIGAGMLDEKDAVAPLGWQQPMPFMTKQLSVHHAAKLADQPCGFFNAARLVQRQRDKGIGIKAFDQFDVRRSKRVSLVM
jgi:hypothetical protein